MTIAPRPFFPKELMAFVARSAKVSMDDLQGKTKTRHLHRARAVISIVMRERGLSYPYIGKLLHRDHSTIVHAVDTFDERYGNDQAAQSMLDYARYEFGKQDNAA